MKSLLIILSLSPFQYELVNHTVALAKSAINNGHRVSLFLFMDGVYNLMMTQEGEPFRLTPFYKRFEEVIELGASIKICKLCKILRGVKDDNIPIGVEAEGIAELNQMILEADRVLSFIR